MGRGEGGDEPTGGFHYSSSRGERVCETRPRPRPLQPSAGPSTRPLLLLTALHPRSSAPPPRSYPEGMLLAIHHLSAVGAPIYITETGVADRGDELRKECIEGYMAQVR